MTTVAHNSSQDDRNSAIGGPCVGPPQPGAAWQWATRGLALVALGLSIYLLGSSLSSMGVAGCDESGGGCGSVLSSRWRSWMGLPVSFLGATVYLVIFIALCSLGPRASCRHRRVAWSVLLPAAVMAGGAALWFVGLQALVVKAFCPYCTAAHVCALMLAGLILAARPIGRDPSAAWGTAARTGLLVVGAAGLVLLIGGQVLMPGSTSRVVRGHTGPYDSGPGPDRTIRLAGTDIQIAPHELPIIGSPDADRIAVVFFGYNCPICRSEYQLFKEAMSRYGSRLAVVWLPLGCRPDGDGSGHDTHEADDEHDHSELIPDRCNYTLLAAAVWRHVPQRFAQFHNWLMTDAPPMLRKTPTDGIPSYEHARAYVASLIGADVLAQALRNPSLKAMVLPWRGWRHSLPDGTGVVPAVSVGNDLIYGEVTTALELFEGIERSLGIAPLIGETLSPAKGAETKEQTR